MKEINLPAGTVEFRELGPLDGPPVVFVHGFMVDGTVWGEVPDLLAAQGYRCVVPTWPLGSHRIPMRAGADLSPRGVARVILSFLEALGLEDVTLVGNDSGGAISQFLIDEDPSRLGRVVLTNCDAFEVFPPFPFGEIFRLARRPALAGRLFQVMRLRALRHSPAAFGVLTQRRLGAAESRAWVMPYLTDANIRRDVAGFVRSVSGQELTEVGSRLGSFDKPVLLAWAPADRYFTLDLAKRLQRAFANARLVEIPGAVTFVALDQPERLAEHIGEFIG